MKFPALVKRTLLHLGVDPTQVEAQDAVEARAAKQVLGGVSSILHGADELRNTRGTGHGSSGTPLVDDALARLTVGAVLPAVLYLIEVFEARTGDSPSPVLASSVPSTPELGVPQLTVGGVVRHDTYGQGQVRVLTGAADKQIAEVDFGAETGVKRMLVRYAKPAPVR